jgi:hypothetical protein
MLRGIRDRAERKAVLPKASFDLGMTEMARRVTREVGEEDDESLEAAR